ncbi:hypothetical protein C483_17453 [Natrialba hulunbeirensis JCM 10989]|uniref:Peptidase S1 domain-containing protein n=2 Tax=Natrialba hulunbeirensis TaxID=123783 RepID=L9ZRC6_9EURY|nr:hypothetical protein C483_17453 [Natrialba hulunbeirensis JCM 10989]
MHNTSGNALEYEFATNHGTTSGDIIGTLSRERIKDIEDDGTWDDEMTYHQGARTGEERGYGIEKVNDNAFQTDIPHDSVQQGDSGGPYYVRNTSSVSPTPFDLIMGVHSWSDADENTWGTIMEVIEDELGVEV